MKNNNNPATRYVLENGVRVIYEKRNVESVTINIGVGVGSNYETKETTGYSHFIEHMAFEGTKKRKDSFVITNEIEQYGGDLNAATSHERTYYYVKIINKQYLTALDVLLDMIINPSFNQKVIEKEKKIVLNEIKMVFDQPGSFQWVIFGETLFKDTPISKPIYGSIESIKKLTKRSLTDFYLKFYKPENITISIAGNIPIKKALEKIKLMFKERDFESFDKKTNRLDIDFSQEKKEKIVNQKKKQLYLIVGYTAFKRTDIRSYYLDIARTILGKGQSGKIFNEIRNKRGLSYNLGVVHYSAKDYGFFCTYVAMEKNNLSKVEPIIKKEFLNLKNVNEKDFQSAKDFIEGDEAIERESSSKIAEELCFWENTSSIKEYKNYIKKINSITLKEFTAFAKRYFTEDYSKIILK